MASVEECLAALTDLARRLAAVDGDTRRKHSVDRTVSCTVPDLDTTFFGRLGDNGIEDLTQGSDEAAQIKLTVSSDDLVALTQGELNLAGAWASGRVKIDASMMDLLKLRNLL